MKFELADICEYVKEKVEVSSITNETYISTENMQPNKGGIKEAATLPTTVQTQAYRAKDVLVSNIRPYFKKIWFAQDEGGCSNDILVFRAKEGVNPQFLYYILSNDAFFEYATATSKGTKMPRGDKKAIMQYKVPDYELKIQNKIVEILNPIDKKIEINRKINDNLEQQMQNLFLKMFPNAFTEKNGTIGKLVSFSNGKKRPDDEGDIPVYGGNGILAYTNVSNNDNCIIIGRVGAYCGSLYYSTRPCWISDNAISAKSIIGNAQLFSYYLLKNASLSSRHIGTGQPLLTQGILNAIPCAIPKTKEINTFNDICTPLQLMVDANAIENVRLAYLRDSILPKLMSGKIDVSNSQF